MTIENGVIFQPYRSTPARVQITPEQQRERRQKLAALLADAMAPLQTAEGWRQLLITRSFSTLTASNLALLALQCPGRDALPASALGTACRGRSPDVWTVGRGFSPVFLFSQPGPDLLPDPDPGGCGHLAADWMAEPVRKGKQLRSFIEGQTARLNDVTGPLLDAAPLDVPVNNDCRNNPDNLF